LARRLTADGLITQQLADQMLQSISALDGADPDVGDSDAAMQALFDFNDAFQA